MSLPHLSSARLLHYRTAALVAVQRRHATTSLCRNELWGLACSAVVPMSKVPIRCSFHILHQENSYSYILLNKINILTIRHMLRSLFDHIRHLTFAGLGISIIFVIPSTHLKIRKKSYSYSAGMAASKKILSLGSYTCNREWNSCSIFCYILDKTLHTL